MKQIERGYFEVFHDYIEGDREGLEKIRDAINEALIGVPYSAVNLDGEEVKITLINYSDGFYTS